MHFTCFVNREFSAFHNLKKQKYDYRSDEVLSASTSNLTGSLSVPALIRRGSDTSLPTNMLWSQSQSVDSATDDEDMAERRGSVANSSASPSRRGSRLLDFLENKKKKDRKRYKDKQGKSGELFKCCCFK